MKKLMVSKNIQLGLSCLFVVATFIVQTNTSVSAQSSGQQTRNRWEKLVYEDAKALIQETTLELAKNPQNAVALRMRSSAFYRNKESEKGKADAVAALALLKSPADAEEFEAKCYAERRLEKYDEALLSCTKAIELDSKYAWAYYNRGSVNEGKKQNEQAAADYTKAIELNPNYFDAYSRRGYIYTLNKEHTKAIADYTKSIELDPKRASVYSARGYVYYYEKEYELAFADFSKAIELDPKYALAYFYRGSAYNNKKEYDKAIADLTKSIELDSKNALAYNARGFAYSYKKEYNSAIADYTRSIELDPKHVLAYYNRAYAYEAKGEKILADKDRQKATLRLNRNGYRWRF